MIRFFYRSSTWNTIYLVAALLAGFFLSAGCSAYSASHPEMKRCIIRYAGQLPDGTRVMGIACIEEPGNT